MDKQALELTDVTRGYGKTIGRSPLIEIPALGAAGAGAGYLAGDFATRGLLKVFMAGRTPAQRARMMQELRKDVTLNLIRKLTAATGGVLGSGYAAYKHMDRGKGIKGALSSLRPGYYDDPDNLQEAAEVARDTIKKAPYDAKAMGKAYTSGRQQQKLGFELDDPFIKDTVPLSMSMELINADPFLTMQQKNLTGLILEDAEGGKTSGLASGKDLTRSAIRLGVGLTAGYAFGRVAGKLLSLPPDITGRLSGAGAIAGGIINTGIFRKQ